PTPVSFSTLCNNTIIQLGTPVRLPTSSFFTSEIMACSLLSHSDISETFLLGTVVSSTQKGRLSINIAERSPNLVLNCSYISALPPKRRFLLEKSRLSG